MKFKIVDSKFKVKTEVDLDKFSINTETSNNILHLFNRYVNNKFRYSTASTKTRSEVSFSKSKVYKQKGTGNARRGANSTPLRRGGGVIFGPTPRSFDFKLNKKFIRTAHRHVLSEINSKSIILDESFNVKKTKEIVNLLNANKITNKVVLLITEIDLNVILPFRNIKNIHIDFIDNYEPELLLSSDSIIFTKASFETLRGYANVWNF